MQYTILISRNENVKEIETQEQSRFIKTILEALEIDVKFNPDESFSIDDKIKMRKALSFYNITIIESFDGGLKIFVERDLIAEWKKPFYKMKQDNSQIDPKNRLYMEMKINFWTVFEQENTKEANI